MPPETPPPLQSKMSSHGMGYYATAHKSFKTDDPPDRTRLADRSKSVDREQARRGEPQDRRGLADYRNSARVANGQERKPSPLQVQKDKSRTYNSLPRGHNYYVQPGSSSTYPQNGSLYPLASMREPKLKQAFKTFACCFGDRFAAKRQRRELFVLPAPKGGSRQNNTGAAHVPNGVITQRSKYGTSSTSQSFFARLFPNRGGHSTKGKPILRPSKLSFGHPSPILGTSGNPWGDKTLLPPPMPSDTHKPCLIVDLDETLVHSSFKPVNEPDFVVPVEIDGQVHNVYVIKRPHVDEFIQKIGDWFECVLFTASLAKYADPVANLLDKGGAFRFRLFREACVYHKGTYIKDLSRLGRDLSKVIILDNSPASYAYHPENAIPVQSWFDDHQDTELLDLLPFLERLATVDNVYHVLTKQISTIRGMRGTGRNGRRRA